jgi:KaiC/GvpD/RAD55 family RecA-like ATPase
MRIGGRGATATSTRRVVVPSPQDLEMAKEDALLQLKIGRSAHYYIVLVSAALFLDGALVLFVQPALTGFAPTAFRSLFFLVPPLVGGVYLSFFSLRLKWEAFQLWPWESHFSLTVVSAALSVVLMAILGSSLSGIGPAANWDLLPGFYALVLLSISLPMAALSLTWHGWPRPKIFSLVAALAPLPLGAVLILPMANAAAAVDALAISLFACAFLYQTSGSFLHLMASGTPAHEQAVITVGQSRMFLLAEDVRKREDVLRLRESSLAKREANVEVAQASVERQKESLAEARGEIDTLELDLQHRSDGLSQEQKTWAAKMAEARASARAVEDRTAAVMLKEQDLAHRMPQIGDREQRAIQKEGEVTRRTVELSQREDELARRAQQIGETESRLEARRQEIDKKTLEHLQRESELRSRTAILGASLTAPGAASDQVKDIEQREARLAQLKLVLDEQNLLLGRKAREAEGLLADARKRADQNIRLESALTQREGALRQKEADTQQQYENASQRVQAYEDSLKRYESQFSDLAHREATVSTTLEETARTGATIQQREQSLRDKEQHLQRSQGDIDQSMRLAIERRKELDDREADLRLREMALVESGGDPEEWLASPAAAPKRSGFRWRSRSTTTDTAEPVLAPLSIADIAATASALDPATARQATGVARLDDLLRGGLPPRSHVLLLGPPYIGKEAVLYAFVAEGLKRSQPAIVVTASRPPDEVAHELSRWVPNLGHMEKRGQLIWIDATDPASKHRTSSTRLIVKGPSDHAGILTSLVAATKSVESAHPDGFRVAFLGLGTSLTQEDPKSGFSFLQNFVGILKPRPATAMYGIDSGAISEGQVATIQGRMDGSIHFQSQQGRTSLAVQGLGDAVTRDWVEYRATDRSITVGSFALERIR